MVTITYSILLLFVVASVFGSPCKFGYESCLSGRPKTYHLSTHGYLNWYQALNHCRSLGMQLASISSPNDALTVKNLTAGLPERSFWTSGIWIPDPGTYFWMSTGCIIANADKNWTPNAIKYMQLPVLLTGSCIYLKHGTHQWDISDCNQEFFSICEKFKDE